MVDKKVSDLETPWTSPSLDDLVEVARVAGSHNFKPTLAEVRALLRKNAQYDVDTTATSFTVAAAKVAGARDVTLVLTGALGSGQNVTLPTAVDLVAAMDHAFVGETFRLRIVNRSSGAFSWTVLTNTGLTLSGTMTIAQDTCRDFVVTLTSLTAVAVQAVGQVPMVV